MHSPFKLIAAALLLQSTSAQQFHLRSSHHTPKRLLLGSSNNEIAHVDTSSSSMSMQAIELESTFDTMDDTSSSLSMSMLMIDDSEAEVPTMEEVTSTILEKVGVSR